MSRGVGIDIGSRTVKVAVVEDGRVVSTAVRYTTHDPLAVCRELLNGHGTERLVATGYGRHLFSGHVPCEVVTEISAVARGARHLSPGCRTVIDVGGQDTKAIALDPSGGLAKFEMNDRCAAGTGRFLEVMAQALGYTMDEFVAAAAAAHGSRKLSSMCTVFAESEVISEVARGTPRDELALGIHRAIADRTAAMARRVRIEDEVLFCGGGAHNGFLARLLEERLGRPVGRPPDPQVAAAIGCALTAAG